MTRLLAVLLLAAAFAMPTRAAELAPEIEVDRLLVRAERQMRAGEFSAAAATLDEMIAKADGLAITLLEVVWIRHAEASFEVGREKRAAESATRYLQTAGRSGEYYRRALELLDEVDRERARTTEKEAIRAWPSPCAHSTATSVVRGCSKTCSTTPRPKRSYGKVTELDFSGDCRLTIDKRDTWDDGLRTAKTPR